MRKIPYGRQEIREEDIQAVITTLKSDFLTQGPAVDEFEKQIGKHIHSDFVLAVNNGTSALHLATMALGVKPGDWVLVATNTFAASANCVRYCGGEVEFVDIDDKNYCIDIHDLKRRLDLKKHKYVGIVAVDFAGYPVDFKSIRQLADEHGLWIIEDACHAIGGYIQQDEKKVYCGGNTLVDISVFSFHPVKHIATGEGGAVSTANPELFEKMKVLRTHGIVRDAKKFTHKDTSDGAWYYEMQELGNNFRMPDLLCALGTSQMKRLPENLEKRQAIAARYEAELKKLPLILPSVSKNIFHAFHLYVIQSERRLDLYNFLQAQGIYCQVHYIPVHRQPYYQNRNNQSDCPKADLYYKKALSLPMYHGLSSADQDYVIQKINEFYGA